MISFIFVDKIISDYDAFWGETGLFYSCRTVNASLSVEMIWLLIWEWGAAFSFRKSKICRVWLLMIIFVLIGWSVLLSCCLMVTCASMRSVMKSVFLLLLILPSVFANNLECRLLSIRRRWWEKSMKILVINVDAHFVRECVSWKCNCDGDAMIIVIASFYRSRENRFSLICDRVRRLLFGLIVVFVQFFLLF